VPGKPLHCRGGDSVAEEFRDEEVPQAVERVTAGAFCFQLPSAIVVRATADDGHHFTRPRSRILMGDSNPWSVPAPDIRFRDQATINLRERTEWRMLSTRGKNG